MKANIILGIVVALVFLNLVMNAFGFTLLGQDQSRFLNSWWIWISATIIGFIIGFMIPSALKKK